MTLTDLAPTTHRQPTAEPANALTGTGTLMRFMLRRDRIKLPAWVTGLGLFMVYLITALPGIAETEEELAATTQLYTEPIGRLMTGPGYGLGLSDKRCVGFGGFIGWRLVRVVRRR